MLRAYLSLKLETDFFFWGGGVGLGSWGLNFKSILVKFILFWGGKGVSLPLT